MSQTLAPNTISFIGLANEYCRTIQDAQQLEKDDFVTTMLRLLPRLYITASDISITDEQTDSDQLPPLSFIDEDTYDAIRSSIAALLGEDDSYLETVEDDMKYSDTPIGASIAEGLADIFQDLFNFTATLRDSDGALTELALADCKENFANYWSQTLCNTLRALNHLHYSQQ